MAKRTILLTGASSGLGKALAVELSDDQTHLVLSARNKKRLEEVARLCKDAGATVEIHQLDISDTKKVAAWINKLENGQPIDIVIGNAGIMETCGPNGELESAEKTISQINTNLIGCVNLASAVVPHMQARSRGQIVFVASMAALQPIADVPGYSASKAGLVAYGEALNSFLHGQGIKVGVICPGFIKTPMNEDYDSFRPFQLSANAAAKKIRKAIDRKASFAAFPLVMEIAIRLGRFLPAGLRRFTNKPFNFVS